MKRRKLRLSVPALITALATSLVLLGANRAASGQSPVPQKASQAPQTAPEPLPTLRAPIATDHILVVSPHPDDETIGAGGFLKEAVAAGASVRIVVATDGNKHGLKAVRHKEIINAVGKLGVGPDNIIFLDYPDGKLSRQTTFQDRLEQISAEFHPNLVIGTHPQDNHPDHAAVGRAIDLLGQHSNHTVTAYFFVVHFPHYPLPDAYKPDLEEVPAPHLVDNASHWENLPLKDEVEQAKCAAVLEYHSQILKKNPLRRGLLISFIRKNEVFAVRSY